MTGSGTLADPFVIWDVNDLQNVALDLGAYYELGQNIDAAATAGWNWDAGLGIFKGFDPVGKRDFAQPIQRPTGDHSSGGAWNIFPADGILWDKVNEVVPDEDARYIQGTADGTWALFNFPNFAIPNGATEIVVRIHMRAKKVAAGTCYIRGYLRVGGSNYSITTWNPELDYSDRAHAFASNPVDWSDWTPDQVNGVGPNHIEAFGVHISDASPNIRVTQVYISVEYSMPFSGGLNGKAYTISNLYINRPTENAAFLGYVNLGINEIKNLNFTNANIRGKRATIFASHWETGSASFINVQGQLTIVTYTGSGLIDTVMTSGTFSHCNFAITVTGAGGNFSIAGAIVNAENTICSDINGTISVHTTGGGDNDIGGFVSITWGTSSFIRCSCQGSIYSEGRGNYGGFCALSSDPITFEDCQSNCSITIVATAIGAPGLEVGGFIAYTCADEQLTNCSAAGSISVTFNGICTKGGGIGGFIDFTCTHELLTRCRTTVDITVVNNGALPSVDIGGFIGFSCDIEEFTECSATGNISFTNNGSLTNFNPAIGGFVGYACWEEIYKRCYSTGNITATMGILVPARDTVVGGFAGGYWSDDIAIENCYSFGDITIVGDNTWVAGFIGQVGTLGAPTKYIKNCYSKGRVNVTGVGNQVGGCIMIDVAPPPITGCFWDVETSGQTTSDGGVGKTSEEMNHIDLFLAAGWDFNSIWNISRVSTVKSGNLTSGSAVLDGLLDLTIINEAYPFLRWQTIVELPCDCGFEWGETELFGNFTAVDSKNTGESFAKPIAGLEAQRIYYYRARASASPGPIHGGTKSFTTLHAIEVETLPATNITENSARIWGRVRKVPVTAMARFDWGGNIEYGAETPWAQGLMSDDTFYYDVRNLAEGRAYHFRAMAMGSSLVYGNDMVFTTRSPVGPVTLIQEELAHLMEVS